MSGGTDPPVAISSLVFDLLIKFLEKKNLSDKVGLRIGFLYEMFQSGKIYEDNDLGVDQVGEKFL